MPRSPRGVLDVGVFHNHASEDALLGHVSDGWREYLIEERNLANLTRLSYSILPYRAAPFPDPLLGKLPEAYPSDGSPPASDPVSTVSHHLEPNQVARALLLHDLGLPLPAFVHHHLAMELTRAFNRDTFERFVVDDDRLYGAILAQTQFPEIAAEEIRTWAHEPKCAAILLAANGLGKPFGHPLYHPIYDAANEVGLPVVICSGGDTRNTVLTQPTAGGMPATWIEHQMLASQPLMTHLASIIGQGVFDLFPNLKVVVAGGGVGWVVPFLWRFELSYLNHRRDMPSLKSTPAEYFFNHTGVATYPLDMPDEPEHLREHLGAEPRLQDVLCFMSGYPNRDRDTLQDVERVLEPEWLPKVLYENAARLFGRLSLPAIAADAAAV